MNNTTTGTLYLAATPIGNLEDITLRVLRILKEVDLIACEDTRTSSHLLSHFDITTPVTSYHKFNEEEKSNELVGRLLRGTNIALITDAGTPAISDPGEILVRKCLDAGITVTSLPGPSAVITALTLSGRDTRRFVFEGFLPQENREKQAALSRIQNETRTIILYEAPHRLKKTLATLAETLGGGRELTLIRELTKKFETVERTTLLAASGEDAPEPRGEYVLVIAGRNEDEILAEMASKWENMTMKEHVALYEKEGMDRKAAMKAAAKDRGISRRDVYQTLLSEDDAGEK